MDDLMTGVGSSGGMDDISNMNELAKQAEAALQPQNNSVQQPTGYGASQNSYGQQSTGYGASQNSYGQQSTGYGASQNSYGQQSTGYGASQNSYGQQSSSYGASQNSYGQRSNDYGSSQSNYSDPYRSGSSGYDSSSSGYGSTAAYTYNDFGGSDSKLIPALKAFLGAAVGAIPGVILVIFVAKLGFIASICGAVMAIGIFAGYTFMTKDNELDTKIGLIICGAVMLLGIYIAVRTSWVMNISDAIKEGMSAGKSMLADSELSESDLNSLYKLIYGVDEPSFSECSSHFSDLLSRFELKGKFFLSFLENLGFAVLGCFGSFAKFGGGSKY